MKKTSTNLLVVAASFVFSLLVLEVILRTLPGIVTKSDLSIADDPREFLPGRSDAYKPNHARTWTSSGPYTVWNFNNLGFRDRNVPDRKLPGTYRIMFVGDSMVMGLGVEDYESMPSQLQKILRQKAGNKMPIVEVYNFGIWGGTGPLEYLDVLKSYGEHFKPDLVIVGFFTGNDIDNTYDSATQKKYYWFRSLPDQIFGYKLNEYLLRKSYLYTFLISRYYGVVEKRLRPRINRDQMVYEKGWELSKEAFKETKKISDRLGTKFLVLGIPSFKEIDKDKNLFTERFSRMSTLSKDANINYLDLYPQISGIHSYRGLFICVKNSCDTHFNPAGNNFVANIIANFIFERKLLELK